MTLLSNPAAVGGELPPRKSSLTPRPAAPTSAARSSQPPLPACRSPCSILLTLLVDVVRRLACSERSLRRFPHGGPNTSSADRRNLAGIKGTIIISVIVAVVAFPLGSRARSTSRSMRLDLASSLGAAGQRPQPRGRASIVYGLLGLAIFVKVCSSPGGHALRRPRVCGPRVTDRRDHRVRGTAGRTQQHPEAGFGVGATRWEVVRSHVLPGGRTRDPHRYRARPCQGPR